MPDPVVSTSGDEGVDSTPETPVVSTDQQSAPPPASKSSSDPERRIANLQSQLDKMRNERDAAIQARAEAQRQMSELQGKYTSEMDGANKATQEALDREKTLSQENATLRAQNSKLQRLVANPDLAPWADLIPATEDAAELDRTIEKIRSARDGERSAIVTQLKTGTVPPVNPTRPSQQMTPAEINRYLQEALNDPKEFEKRREEVARLVKPG